MSHKKSIFFNISLINFAKICISVYYTDFITQNVQPADAWGRLRNPSTGQCYSLTDQPELLIGRGFSGHEHLPWVCLVNMNARLYNPLLGRFLSPDPYVQAPDFSQSFNRYAYALNNPLKYRDEDGEFWNYVIGAVIGGISNRVANGHKFTIKGLGYFAVGAAAGAMTSGASAFTASAVSACGVYAGALVGAATGAATGAVSNYVTNGGNNLISGHRFGLNWRSSLMSGALSGAVSGAIVGGITGGENALRSGKNVWWGNSTRPGTGQWTFLNMERPQVFKSPVFDNYGNQNGECVLRCLEEFSESYGDDTHDFNYWLHQNGDKLGVAPSEVVDLINGSDLYGSQSLLISAENIISAFNQDQRVMFGFASDNGLHAVMINKIKLWSNGSAKIFFRETSPVRIVEYSAPISSSGFVPRYPGSKIWSFFKL